MPQPVSYTTGNPVSGSLLDNRIAYVVDGQGRDYRGGYGGLSWMSEAQSNGNVVFIGNTTSVGRGPAGKPLFWVSPTPYEFDIINTINTLPGSPGNFTTTGSAYSWAVTNNFFVVDGYFNKPSANGLIYYLDASQPGSYPTTGTTWYDLSGRNGTGVLTNGPTYNSNGWIDFDGVDDYVPFSAPVGSATTVTVEMVCEIPASYTNKMFFGWGGYDVWCSGGDLGYNTNNGDVYGISAATVSSLGLVDKWKHYVFEMRSDVSYTNNKIYVNGEALTLSQQRNSENAGNRNFNSGNGQFPGYRSSPTSYVMDYNVNYFKIYSGSLSQTEIKQNLFQSNIVQDGLAFMVDPSNLVSYETGSTTTYSLTGSNTGTLTNGVGYSKDFGGNFQFDGTDDYIDTNYPLNGSNAFSVDCWFKVDRVDKDWQSVVDAYLNATDRNFQLWVNNNAKLYVFHLGSSHTGAGQLSPNVWYNAVFTYGGSGNGVLYLNGAVLEASVPKGAGSGGNVNVDIGRRTDGNGSSYTDGNISTVKIYNRALSAVEVQQNYQATKDRFQPTQGILPQNLTLYMDPANPASVDSNLGMSNLVNGNAIIKGSNTVASFEYGNQRSMISSAGPDGSGTLDTGFRTGSVTVADNRWVDSSQPWTVQTWIYKHSSNTANNWWHVITDGSSGDMFTVYNNAAGTMQTSMNNPSYGGVFDVGSDIVYGFTWRDDVKFGWNLITLRYDPAGQTVQLSLNDQHDAPATGRVINPNYRLRNFHGWGSSNSSYHSDPAFSTTLAYQALLSDAEVEYNFNVMKGRFGL